MRIPFKAVKLIQSFESLHDGDKDTPDLEPALDPVGIVTYGWGRVAIDPETRKVLRGPEGWHRAMTIWGAIDRETADAWFEQDLARFGGGVSNAVKVPLSQNQFGACVSLAYNIGLAAFRKSTVCRLINKGDTIGAARAFGMWNKSTVDGKKIVLPGLVRRRAAESALFLDGSFVDPHLDVVPRPRPTRAPEMPESSIDRVERPVTGDDHSLATSRTTIGGTVAAGATAANAGLTDIMDILTPLQPYSTYIATALTVLAIAGACLAIYARFSDRNKGKG